MKPIHGDVSFWGDLLKVPAIQLAVIVMWFSDTKSIDCLKVEFLSSSYSTHSALEGLLPSCEGHDSSLYTSPSEHSQMILFLLSREVNDSQIYFPYNHMKSL